MSINLINCKYFKTLTAAMLVGAIGCAFADKQSNQITEIISAIETNSHTPAILGDDTTLSTPNSFVTLDFSIANGESWDAKDQPKNVITNCIDGKTITGFEYSNVTIKTVGGSYFSEAVIYFSDSNNGDDGIRLTIGAGNESSGTATFSSDGVLDITDSGNEDVNSLSNDNFNIQFYEIIDDSPDAVDARFTNGLLKVWGTDLVATNSCQFAAGILETDLSVEYLLNQNKAQGIGESLTFDVIVNNNGANTATNVVLENEISPRLQFTNMACTGGTTFNNIEDIIMMSVQDIAANSSLSCSISANIIASGQISNSVVVTADNDSDISNNSATVFINGIARVIPVNNRFAIAFLLLCLVFYAKRSAKFQK